MMRIFRIRIPLLLTVAVTSLSAAEGEYFYRFPETMLPGAGQRDRLLERGHIVLFSGNIRCAEAVLNSLRAENPLLDTRLFPAELMLAKNQQEKARVFLQTPARSNLDTPESELARCMLGELFLDSGNPCAAIHCFQKLAERPKAPASWRAAARRGEVLAWIRLGNYAKADAVLRKTSLEFPNAGTTFHLPELLNLSCSGRSNLLLERWKTMKEEFAPRPEPILYHLLMEGAEHSRKRNEWQTAQELFAAAYHYTSTDRERMDIFRKLLNIQCKNSPERALKTIGKFLRFFPELPDRFDLEFLRGMLHYQVGQFKEAIESFTHLISNPKTSGDIQVRAAEAAAQSAEKNKDFKLAYRMYNTAIDCARDSERKQELQIELMKFLLRTKEYAQAGLLAVKIEPFLGKENDELNLLHLQALIALKKYPEAAAIALRLTRSPVKKDAAEGLFQYARAIEQQGRTKEARRCYLQYVKRFPQGSHAPEAYWAAAEIAFQNREYIVAEKEFEKFSGSYPKHTKAPEALLAALYAVKADDAVDNETDGILRLYKEFSSRFPKTPEYDTAVLLTAESLFYAKEYGKAITLLNPLFSRSAASPQMPEAVLLKARCLSEQKKSAEARELLLKFLEKHPGSPLAPDAALEAGRCCCRLGDYPQALRCYNRVIELAGNSFVKTAALCESADCRLLFKSPIETKKAQEIYREVAKDSRYPALQLEAMFKAGSASEQLSQPMNALNFYEKVVEMVYDERKYLTLPGVSNWCSQAAQSALQLFIKLNISNGFQRAYKIYQQYKELSIPGNHAELENYLSALRSFYNLSSTEK